jgi:hypothetical protein
VNEAALDVTIGLEARNWVLSGTSKSGFGNTFENVLVRCKLIAIALSGCSPKFVIRKGPNLRATFRDLECGLYELITVIP